jgi:hypothetical protein
MDAEQNFEDAILKPLDVIEQAFDVWWNDAVQNKQFKLPCEEAFRAGWQACLDSVAAATE